jgi:hypothetical protein
MMGITYGSLVNLGLLKRIFDVISRASRVFGLPSTIRTCDLGLRSWKNELKQLVKQWDQGVGFWCGIGTEICGIRWNNLDLTWHWQAVGWSDVKFVGLTDKLEYEHICSHQLIQSTQVDRHGFDILI